MKNLKSALIGLLFPLISFAQLPNEPSQGRIMLPTGWSLSPAGKSLHLGDLPLNIAVSNSKKLLAVTNNGQSDQTIFLIDPVNQRILDTILVGKSWLGLTFSTDEQTLYASGGNDNWVMSFDVSTKKLMPKDTFLMGKPWPEPIGPAGLAIDDKRSLLYCVTMENYSLYIFDLRKKQPFKRIPLGAEAYACLLSPDRKNLYISCWGCDKVQIFNTEKEEISGSVPVGDNPNDLCISKSGKFLYVANANDNSVSVIDLAKKVVIETLNAALYPGAPSGSTTNSVALSEDEKTLYVANADNNCLAVFDVSNPGHSRSKGFIPVGWYPTCVRFANNTIYVANGKGFQSYANPNGPDPSKKKQKVIYQGGDPNKKTPVQYIGGLFHGTLSMIPAPDEKQMLVYTQMVYRNTPYKKQLETEGEGKTGNPVPQHVGDVSPIKYVFYIIKENRTYDQVLGDEPRGNGDTNLTLFGKKITPNQHKLENDFVLLDNFFVIGEVSADGHNWSMGAYATDFLEKTWPTGYGGRGGNYSAEGGREVANNKDGFIWDMCRKYGVSYETYGEFADDFKPNIPVLSGHVSQKFEGWNQDIMDTTRYFQWQREFDSLLAIGKVPQLNTLRFINDHTQGLHKGARTPFAEVADNDLATGLFVEHLSKSPIWDKCAVFILEDDAQNGSDHVDAHRSACFLAGGFVKRNFVDHTFYTTLSVLKTIELVLGLPPMSQHDAAATPMWRCFNDTVNAKGFTALGAEIDLQERNTAMNKWSEMSDRFDWTAEDRAPEQLLNQILWIAAKGEKAPLPAPVHAAFIEIGAKAVKEEKD